MSVSGRRRQGPVPVQSGPYVCVYRPAGDRYTGPDTATLRSGTWYDEWVPNDHAFVQGPDLRWHAFGITHPLTGPAHIHDGEVQSFHAVAPKGPLRAVLQPGLWRDLPKVLPPSERPLEIPEQHAPCIVQNGPEYWMIYGPNPIRIAVSTDLMTWQPRGPLLEEAGGARDPCVLHENGLYHLVFCSQDGVRLRTSADLVAWSESQTVLTMPFGVAPESPCLVRRGKDFLLFVCGWDGVWDRREVQGAYQHVTCVYRSEDPTCFSGDEVTRLAAHAPEVFQGEDGAWYISSAEWPCRGVSIAPLEWE